MPHIDQVPAPPVPRRLVLTSQQVLWFSAAWSTVLPYAMDAIPEETGQWRTNS
jgi:hypothetical protein